MVPDSVLVQLGWRLHIRGNVIQGADALVYSQREQTVCVVQSLGCPC